jgi:dihydroorotate dehydrogenase (NAD+) catalytic subunit
MRRQCCSQRRRNAAGLTTEQEAVARLVTRFVITAHAIGLDHEQARGTNRCKTGGHIGMQRYARQIVIVEPGALELRFTQVKSEFSDQVQVRTCVGTQPDGVAGVGRNFRLEQQYVEHVHQAPTGPLKLQECSVFSDNSRMNAAMETPPAARTAAWQPPAASLALDFCGMHFASPIVLLSGCVGFGEEYTRVAGFSNRDVGAVCLKGTTLAPRLGNKPHRVYETPMGMLNAIGLQNPGVDVVVREILPALDFSETRFIANVSGSTVEEYTEVTARCNDSPIDAIEINISCPNVKEGGVAFGNSPEMSARVVAACRKVTRKPLITKLSPNQTDIALNARMCIEAGTDAFAVINTLMGMAIDTRTRKPVIGNRQGGLSGPAIKPIALLKVAQVSEVAKPHRIPIIGQGGIVSANDALEFLIAGATAVGVGTALFYDPLVCPKINRGIADYLAANGLANLAALAA